MSKWIVGAVAAMALVSASGCGRGADRMEKMVHWKLEDAMDELDATPKQRERVGQLEKQLLTDVKPLAQSAQEAKAELAKQVKAPVADAQVVHAVVDRQLDAARVFAHKLADGLIEIHGMLTPEQRKEVNERLDKRMK